MDITSYLLGKNSSGGGGGGGSDLDWTAIGYSGTPQVIIDGYNYAKNIYDNWVPKGNMSSAFYNKTDLTYMPLIDTSIAYTMDNTFSGCNRLQSIPLLNTSNVTNMASMFLNCVGLTSIP